MNYSQKFDGAVKFAQVDATTINAERVNAEQVVPAGLTIENGAVTGYTGAEGKVAVPDYIGTTPTTQISAFQNASVVDVVLPSTLTHIDASAFSGCTALQSIDLPASIEQIGANAFTGCTSLTKVVCRATSVPVTGANAFPTGLTIQVPQSALSAYQSAWSSYGTVEAIPFDGVAELAKQATNADNIKVGTEYKSFTDALLQLIYPVGSIYLSVNNVSPQVFLGGSWVAWGSGRVPVGVDTAQTEFATVEKEGGEKSHTLTVGEMPSHGHDIPFYQIGGQATLSTVLVKQNGTPSSLYNVSSEVVGNNDPHNNLQPYITCYMWKRTA